MFLVSGQLAMRIKSKFEMIRVDIKNTLFPFLLNIIVYVLLQP